MTLPADGAFALVTGAGGGIGAAVARALSQAGAGLVLVGRRRDRLESTAAALASPADVIPTDLTVDDQVDSLIDEVGRRCDHGLDVLVHCAGSYQRGSVAQCSAKDLDRLLATNVGGPYQLTRGLLPFLRAARGQVVFVNSTQGLTAAAGLSQYAATQHALRAVADSLRAEVNSTGVRVLTLHLGRTATPLQEEVFRFEGRPYRPDLLMQPDDVAMMIASCLQLPRTAEVTTVTMRPMVKSY
jgi:NADP-dependent 3-hydroxy acid dehydrogenase YdfG